MAVLQKDVLSFLEMEIKPQLSSHGGYVDALTIHDGVLEIKLGGQCSGCPCADITVHSLIKEEVQKKFPEIKEVKLASQVSDMLLQSARMLMKR